MAMSGASLAQNVLHFQSQLSKETGNYKKPNDIAIRRSHSEPSMIKNSIHNNYIKEQELTPMLLTKAQDLYIKHRCDNTPLFPSLYSQHSILRSSPTNSYRMKTRSKQRNNDDTYAPLFGSSTLESSSQSENEDTSYGARSRNVRHYRRHTNSTNKSGGSHHVRSTSYVAAADPLSSTATADGILSPNALHLESISSDLLQESSDKEKSGLDRLRASSCVSDSSSTLVKGDRPRSRSQFKDSETAVKRKMNGAFSKDQVKHTKDEHREHLKAELLKMIGAEIITEKERAKQARERAEKAEKEAAAARKAAEEARQGKICCRLLIFSF